jgi:DsbE subfamily thiol:disulfide oxidoreductase
MRQPLYIIPLAVFLTLMGLFIYRLVLIDRGNAPDMIPSVLLNKPMPDFDLPSLEGKSRLKASGLKGKVILINFFSSWCVPCRAEHMYLEEAQKAGIQIVGINYKDKPADARAWLAKLGNPYTAIGSDSDGHTAIDFGVYGVPESYLIDKSGIVRFKQTGPLTPEVIENQLVPLAKELSK